MKILLNALLLLSCLTFFAACGGGPTTANRQTTADSAVNNFEPDIKSDSKGVGRFTSVKLSTLNVAQASQGEALFMDKCAACHKTTTDNTVGPGLKWITKRRTPEWILNQLTNPAQMEQKDPVSRALLQKHPTGMAGIQPVSDDEARQILEYFRRNDGGGQ